MAYKGPPKVQKVMVQPINLIFRYLQNRSRVQIWLYENVNLRLEGHIVGFDEYMNIVLDEAEEYHIKTKNRRQIGRIMMKGGKSASSFMERCITFIGDNAADCVKTNAFLNLPKEALIKLISSDFLCLEEEEVWRGALAWSKQRAGVTQPAAHWTEEERARVCLHLAPLMHHVRLLLIDSAVFAEEVEPTGAVPMELSLERYRRAALHSAPLEPDKRTQPRLAVNMFAGSLILQQEKSTFQAVINNWCGTPKQSWRLVFRASAHGYSAQAFHAHCDGVEPVLLLVQPSRGPVLGGFSSAGWRGAGYAPAERACLFSLAEPPALYALHKKPFAICYHPDCGPIFGAGADLLISHECHRNCESYSNLHSYGDGAGPASLAPDYNFTVADYELFTCD